MDRLLAILEEETLRFRRRDRTIKALAAAISLLTVVVTVLVYRRDGSLGNALGSLIPLVCFVGVAAGYSPRHRKALQDAIENPDAALDPHFARALAAHEVEVAALGRKAFVERFAHRTPEMDDDDWVAVARALPLASNDEAERMLALLRSGGTGGAIAPVEAFSAVCKAEYLQTAARQTLGEIRLRTARGIVESRTLATEDEMERARLRACS